MDRGKETGLRDWGGQGEIEISGGLPSQARLLVDEICPIFDVVHRELL